MEKCEEITIGINLDEINILTNPANDLFYFNRLFALKLVEIAQRKNCDINIVKLEKNHLKLIVQIVNHALLMINFYILVIV